MGCTHCPNQGERWHPENVCGLLVLQHCVTSWHYPMLRVDNLIHRLGKATAFDLSCGCWQVNVCKDAHAKQPREAGLTERVMVQGSS